jgi:hypothetical protein
MHIGLHRGEIGEHALRKIDHVVRRIEIVDRFLAETGRKHEVIDRLAGRDSDIGFCPFMTQRRLRPRS